MHLKTRGRLMIALIVAACFALTAIAATSSHSPTIDTGAIAKRSAAPIGVSPPIKTAAWEMLDGLRISEPLVIEYDVDVFGQKWADLDRNGCDQRNDTLRRDLSGITIKPNTNGCVVLTGTLRDPYTGETHQFVRVSTGYQPAQIDHIVPRKYAATHGALDLTAEQRLQFANDPSNLQTTTANQVKGDRGPADWLPVDEYQCEYASRFIQVADTYQLSITAADYSALGHALSLCTS